MAKSYLTAFILILLFSCQSSETSKVGKAPNQDTANNDTLSNKLIKPAEQKISFYTLDGDSVLVPPFEIEISLTPKAKERIVTSKETIIVAVFLEGKPKDSAKAHFEEDGSFFVGSAKKEISFGQIARIDNLRFPKKIYDQLVDKDVDLTVNVYSGRKSSNDNLIDVDLLADKVSNIINKKFLLKGKLIYGDD